VLQSRGGELTRTMTWGYYPDGKLASLSDQGIPSGRVPRHGPMGGGSTYEVGSQWIEQYVEGGVFR
jgi:hypothetical protein